MEIEFHELQVKNLHLKRGVTQICQALDLHLSNGEMLEILGDNGVGKTSLLRTIAGLTTPDRGKIVWNQHILPQAKEKYAAVMNYLGHQTGLHPQLSPRENLTFYRDLRSNGDYANNVSNQSEDSSKAIEAALQYFKMGAFADMPCYTLSKGQAQRVVLARLLVGTCPIWLLDEPGAALDRNGITLLEKLIGQHLKRGGIALVSTHRQISPANVTAQRLVLPRG